MPKKKKKEKKKKEKEINPKKIIVRDNHPEDLQIDPNRLFED